MARSQEIPNLSIIIPTINEASHLPLLIADLKGWPLNLELIVVDGGSSDLTISITKIQGVKVIKSLKLNRGYQLNIGASIAKGNWLLFLHADSRLIDSKSVRNLIDITKDSLSEKYGWYFDFKINKNELQFRILELAVALRCYFLQRPYGDQGLLINKSLYQSIGGFSSLKIMEDIELITRLTKKTKLKRIGAQIYTDGRKWDNTNIINRAIKNARLRKRWRTGYDINKLSKEYYL